MRKTVTSKIKIRGIIISLVISVLLFEKLVDIQFHSCIVIATRTRLSITVLLVLPLNRIRGNYSG